MQCLVRSKFAFRRPWNLRILESEWHSDRRPHIQIQPDRLRDVGTVLISTVRLRSGSLPCSHLRLTPPSHVECIATTLD